MKPNIRRVSAQRGFSLIEVMIAVVVLAIGLLALGALQASLSRNSADAKVRGRVASMLTARLDELRSGSYGNTALDAGTQTFTCANATWLCTVESQAGASNLALRQVNTRYWSERNAASFAAGSTAVTNGPEFKRVVLTASWMGADSATQSLTMSTDISSVALSDTLMPGAPTLAAVAAGSPTVRQDNPASAAVIPIAIGGDNATAASNPRPEIIGKNNNQSAVGTRFNVLTYEGLTGAATIQRRVETAVISCSCQYGAGGDNLPEIYRTAQWPAVWTGEKYEVYKPATPAPAPGASLASGPTPGVEQSMLCQECCRDHHDDTAVADARFDPVRAPVVGETTGTEKYLMSANGQLTIAQKVSGQKYTNACRVIRVDGWWRTASDTYAKHIGQIKTSAVNGVAAKSGVPDEAVVTSYQSFVKGYLGAYNGTQPTIDDAVDGGYSASTIDIRAPAPADERYLHSRGLYVDYLGQKARERIAQAITDANCLGNDKIECMLPYLPFTTINTTELAYWEPQVDGQRNDAILTVASGSSLIHDPLMPTRGRTNAKVGAANGAEADATSSIGRSNSGLAVGVSSDPEDEDSVGRDSQSFRVVSGSTGGPVGGDGQAFSVRLSGLPQTADNNGSNDPAVAWVNQSGLANCTGTFTGNNDRNPNDYACVTFAQLGVDTTVTVANYFRVDASQSRSLTCGTLTVNYATPRLVNYRVSTISVNGVASGVAAASQDNSAQETTAISLTALPANALVELGFADENNGAWATVKTCQLNGGGNQIKSVTWNEAWAQ